MARSTAGQPHEGACSPCIFRPIWPQDVAPPALRGGELCHRVRRRFPGTLTGMSTRDQPPPPLPVNRRRGCAVHRRAAPTGSAPAPGAGRPAGGRAGVDPGLGRAARPLRAARRLSSPPWAPGSPSAGEVSTAYAAAGLGVAGRGRAVGWCFLAGVVAGAPRWSAWSGPAYVTDADRRRAALAGRRGCGGCWCWSCCWRCGGRPGRCRGPRSWGLVAVLVAVGSWWPSAGRPSHARVESWTPFAPHGWGAIGTAASTELMLSFVGWEAVAPLTATRRPRAGSSRGSS